MKLADEVLDLMPRFLEKDGVVAVGEIGFDDQTDAEESALLRQLEMARVHDLPVLIHTPHRDKKQGTVRTIEAVRRSGIPEERVLIDHNNEETLPIVLASRCWAGHSIYPHTKMDEGRMAHLVQQYGADRIVINSAADWGISDPLKVPKTVAVMREQGIPEATISRIVWDNPVAFFGQTGRLELADLPVTEIDLTRKHEGNTLLRGDSTLGRR